MSLAYRRSPHTWILFLIFAIFGYVINALGPVTPFLKSELDLSYTVTSLVFSAFAAGMILTGLTGHLLVKWLGRGRVIWLGLFGMCLCVLGMSAAQSAGMAISASFFTGVLGSLLPSLVPSSLSDEHGENRSVALSESNLIAAVSSGAAPLMVGWFSYTWLGWRFALVLPLAAALGLFFLLGRGTRFDHPAAGQPARGQGRLPARYWVLWVAMVLIVAVEYCMLFWGADYLENAAGLTKGGAAQAISLFLGGMVLGRLAGSRLVQRFSAYQVITASILVAAAGFGLYWSALAPWLTVFGLFIAGLGTANQFPLILSLAIGAADGNSVQASTRSALASGIAVFALPLVLGRLADAAGIRPAYGLVLVLLAAAFFLVQATAQRRKPHPAISA